MPSKQFLHDTATRLERALRTITGPERASVRAELDDVQAQCGRQPGGHTHSPAMPSSIYDVCAVCGHIAQRKAA